MFTTFYCELRRKLLAVHLLLRPSLPWTGRACLDNIAFVVAQGFGPALVALLISALGRQAAFTLSVAGWLPCGALIGTNRSPRFFAETLCKC